QQARSWRPFRGVGTARTVRLGGSRVFQASAQLGTADRRRTYGAQMNEDKLLDRRRFLAGVVSVVAASQLGTIDSTLGSTRAAAAAAPRAIAEGGHNSFGALK